MLLMLASSFVSIRREPNPGQTNPRAQPERAQAENVSTLLCCNVVFCRFKGRSKAGGRPDGCANIPGIRFPGSRLLEHGRLRTGTILGSASYPYGGGSVFLSLAACQENAMHRGVKIAPLFGIFLLTCSAALAKLGPSSADDRGSMVVTFKDGHRQRFAMSEIARLDFKTPATIIFKDGHQQNIPTADIARIEFESSAVSASVPGRAHFVGKWEVGEGNGRTFVITLEADGEATKSIGAGHGTWTVVDGEARISWDDGWHDAIRKVGAKHEKFAYEPGKSFDDPPSNVTAARNTLPRPI